MAFTFFFRDHHTLQQITNHFLPIVSGYRKIRIWDAGCANGPEPYTFAIILAEKMGHFAFKNVHIDATDIDETDTFGNIINNGVYPESDLKRIPPEVFKKYFYKQAGGDYRIDDKIKLRVHFTKHNLLSLQPVGTSYNLIMCKNVLLHFQPEERVNVIKMFHSVLAPGGIFATEQTQQMPEALNSKFKKLTTDANIYQKL